jgi:hypothetical protein
MMKIGDLYELIMKRIPKKSILTLVSMKMNPKKLQSSKMKSENNQLQKIMWKIICNPIALVDKDPLCQNKFKEYQDQPHQ